MVSGICSSRARHTGTAGSSPPSLYSLCTCTWYSLSTCTWCSLCSCTWYRLSGTACESQLNHHWTVDQMLSFPVYFPIGFQLLQFHFWTLDKKSLVSGLSELEVQCPLSLPPPCLFPSARPGVILYKASGDFI